MSSAMLKSIVSNLKAIKPLTLNDVVTFAKLSSDIIPLVEKIKDYLQQNKSLSHAQYYELIAMANGCNNFDTFKATLVKNEALSVKTNIKSFTTGSLLLDHFIKQFNSGFKIKTITAETNSFYPDTMSSKMESEEEILKVIDTLNIVRNDKGVELVASLSTAFQGVKILKLKLRSMLYEKALKEIDIPIRETKLTNQSIVDQEKELLNIAVALEIIQRSGGRYSYKDKAIGTIGVKAVLDFLSESSEIAEQIRTECTGKINQLYPLALDPQTKYRHLKDINFFDSNSFGYSMKILGLTNFSFCMSQEDFEETLNEYFNQCKPQNNVLAVKYKDGKPLFAGVMLEDNVVIHKGHQLMVKITDLEKFASKLGNKEAVKDVKYYKSKTDKPVLDQYLQAISDFAQEEFNLSLPKYLSIVEREESRNKDWIFRMKDHAKEIKEYKK